MPSSTSLPSPQSVLPSLAIAGTCFIWAGSFIDGSLILLLKAVFSRKHILPGTQSLLKRSFTGIYWPLDFLLGILVVFFWEAVDGSHPTSSTLGLYFIAQYLPILTTVYTDSFRTGNAALKSGATSWLLVFQACGFGSAGPLWALSYFKKSPLFHIADPNQLQAASAAPTTSLLVLPLSLLLGYLVPSFLMCIKSPGVVSNNFQQKAIATWNVFPLWVLCVQKILEHLATRGLGQTTLGGSRLAHMRALRAVNTIVAAAGFASHVMFLSVAASSALLPGIWAPGIAQDFSPRRLLVPPIPLLTSERSSTVGDGVRGFFMWDMLFGFLLAILVALWQFEAATRASGKPLRVLPAATAVAIGSAVLGPGTTTLMVSWARDELLFDVVADVVERLGDGELMNGELENPSAEFMNGELEEHSAQSINGGKKTPYDEIMNKELTRSSRGLANGELKKPPGILLNGKL